MLQAQIAALQADLKATKGLIQAWRNGYEVPTTLPPHRTIDHRIHLLPNTKPVNVRPYRYPHYQKVEMEKLVKEMMEQGKGVKMDPKKVAAVIEWPVPITQQHIRGFLGLAGYYRWFIKKFATVAAPLSRLLQKQGFQWGDMENKAFQDLKARLSEAPILGLPNFEDMFIVEADASNVGIGTMLIQNGKPLSYFSRQLGPRIRVAATYQKELFAIVEAVDK
ncbi:ty3-gypsy retrotransposon protein [Tanacetum coccineum]